MARDTQYREELKKQVDLKLEKAEKKRNFEEGKKYQSIAESNRREAKDHQLRMKKLEEIYSDHIEKVKNGIDMKLKRAEEMKEQEMLKWGNRRESCGNPSAVLSLKAELDAGLDLWRKQVLSVQSLSILKAEARARKEIENKKQKIVEEMKNKEKRFQELRSKNQAKSRVKVQTFKQNVIEKNQKIEKLVSDRNNSIVHARNMAETSAQLRTYIKCQLKK